MLQTATITSKRQLTIPVKMFKSLNLQKGSKVIISLEDRILKIQPSLAIVEKLAGSVSIPPEFKNLTVDQIIQKAKEERFKNTAE